MSATVIAIGPRLSVSLRIIFDITVWPCQWGLWTSSPLALENKYHRTRSPLFMVNIGRFPLMKPFIV
jgi:hypothetical protein